MFFGARIYRTPSDKVNIALFGRGGSGQSNVVIYFNWTTYRLLGSQIRALMDLNRFYYKSIAGRGTGPVEMIEDHYQKKRTWEQSGSRYKRFSEMMDKEKISMPFFWRLPLTIPTPLSPSAALKAGWHVFCEKTHGSQYMRKTRMVNDKVVQETGTRHSDW